MKLLLLLTAAIAGSIAVQTQFFCPLDPCELLEADIHGEVPFLVALDVALSNMNLVQRTLFLPVQLQLETAVNANQTCAATLSAIRTILNGLSGAVRTIVFGTRIIIDGILWGRIEDLIDCVVSSKPRDYFQ